MTSLWYDQLPGWRKHHPIVKLLFCIAIVMALPLLAVIYLIHPRGSVGRFLRSPMIKFVNHSASIAIFLVLLLIASTDGQSIKALEQRQKTRGPDPNRIELLILWWVAETTPSLRTGMPTSVRSADQMVEAAAWELSNAMQETVKLP
ncbi:unnamed protein product [Dibothriocephalus latus]|uniref:Uncharacterized protein n=1 Tax=Dibothriocephalus latus TaxID=60516 RepID=A0A3P7LYF2_DIBLA|nr:unnamed protein product [Dibothriocephalus latus]